MVTDGNWTYSGDYFITSKDLKSLCCTPETNIILVGRSCEMELHVFPIPIPPPTSLYTRFLWVSPVHQAGALVSCIQPGLVISTADFKR